MADTLIIGGKTYTGVTGIKATDDSDVVQTFTKGGGGYFVVAYLTDTITNRTIQVGSGSRQNMANGGKYSFNSGDTIVIRLVDGGDIYRNGQRVQTTGSSTITYTFTAPSAYLAIECISDKIYICDIEVE